MGMRDFFRGEHDRDRDRDRWRENWRDENRYGRGEEQRYMQGRDWGRDEDNEREFGRYGSYSGGFENPQFYGQSGRSDWRESDYGRNRDWQSHGGYGQRDWGRDVGDRFRGGEQRRYGGGSYTGESERGGYGGGQYRGYGGSQFGGGQGGGQYGQYGGSQYGSETGGSGSRWGREGYGGSGSMSSQSGGLSGSFRGRGPKGYQRADERIREDVCECLTDDPMIDASNIEVNVKSGEVTLTGTVNSRQDKRHAVEIVEDLSGVKDVHNNLRVASEQSMQGSQQTSGAQSTQQPRH